MVNTRPLVFNLPTDTPPGRSTHRTPAELGSAALEQQEPALLLQLYDKRIALGAAGLDRYRDAQSLHGREPHLNECRRRRQRRRGQRRQDPRRPPAAQTPRVAPAQQLARKQHHPQQGRGARDPARP